MAQLQRRHQNGRKFRSINERNKVEVTDTAQFPPALRELNEALASPAFVETVSSISVFAICSPTPSWSEMACTKRAHAVVSMSMSISTTSRPGNCIAG